MNEAQIQKQIVDYLRHTGWFVAITSQKGISFATPGLPDLIAVKDSIRKRRRTVWIEVKGPRGRQRPEQIKFQDELERHGGDYLLANNLDVVIDYLKGRG